MKKTRSVTQAEYSPAEANASPPDWQQTANSFIEFHRAHRGVCNKTLSLYRSYLSQFEEHISSGGSPVRPDQIAAHHIDSFLLLGHCRGRDWARHAASKLRVFLRYLALLGYVQADLASQVLRPRIYRLAGLPKALDEADLRQILRMVPRRDSRGRREYAILMMFSAYGLRVSDVAALRLEDIRWRESSIAIHVAKTGRPLVLPLLDSVGDALAAYIQRARPLCDCREVFLTIEKPFRPLKPRQISKLVGIAMNRAGVKRGRKTSHAFRHSFATRLVRNGVALDTIANSLGHATSATTFIYTKLAIDDLRSVSLDPREVLQ